MSSTTGITLAYLQCLDNYLANRSERDAEVKELLASATAAAQVVVRDVTFDDGSVCRQLVQFRSSRNGVPIQGIPPVKKVVAWWLASDDIDSVKTTIKCTIANAVTKPENGNVH